MNHEYYITLLVKRESIIEIANTHPFECVGKEVFLPYVSLRTAAGIKICIYSIWNYL
ncbi:hypothetical protein BH11PAT1_BH11PAT1_5190 [soil metagenome]